MDAVGWVQVDLFARGRGSVGILQHLVNIRRAEKLAGVAVFLHAARVADVGVVNHQVRGLIFFVAGAGVVEVGQLVEGQFFVALGQA